MDLPTVYEVDPNGGVSQLVPYINITNLPIKQLRGEAKHNLVQEYMPLGIEIKMEMEKIDNFSVNNTKSSKFIEMLWVQKKFLVKEGKRLTMEMIKRYSGRKSMKEGLQSSVYGRRRGMGEYVMGLTLGGLKKKKRRGLFYF